MKVLASVDEDKPQNVINDCKCDRQGRLWFGTLTFPVDLDNPSKEGSLYCFDGGSYMHYYSINCCTVRPTSPYMKFKLKHW